MCTMAGLNCRVSSLYFVARSVMVAMSNFRTITIGRPDVEPEDQTPEAGRLSKGAERQGGRLSRTGHTRPERRRPRIRCSGTPRGARQMAVALHESLGVTGGSRGEEDAGRVVGSRGGEDQRRHAVGGGRRLAQDAPRNVDIDNGPTGTDVWGVARYDQLRAYQVESTAGFHRGRNGAAQRRHCPDVPHRQH